MHMRASRAVPVVEFAAVDRVPRHCDALEIFGERYVSPHDAAIEELVWQFTECWDAALRTSMKVDCARVRACVAFFHLDIHT